MGKATTGFVFGPEQSVSQSGMPEKGSSVWEATRPCSRHGRSQLKALTAGVVMVVARESETLRAGNMRCLVDGRSCPPCSLGPFGRLVSVVVTHSEHEALDDALELTSPLGELDLRPDLAT